MRWHYVTLQLSMGTCCFYYWEPLVLPVPKTLPPWSFLRFFQVLTDLSNPKD